MREKCPYSKLFIPNSGKCGPDNSEYGHFLGSASFY